MLKKKTKEEKLKIFTVYPNEIKNTWNYISEDEVKCGNCNWYTSRLFVIARSREEAIKFVQDGKDGVCGECMSDRLSYIGFELKAPED